MQCSNHSISLYIPNQVKCSNPQITYTNRPPLKRCTEHIYLHSRDRALSKSQALQFFSSPCDTTCVKIYKNKKILTNVLKNINWLKNIST